MGSIASEDGATGSNASEDGATGENASEDGRTGNNASEDDQLGHNTSEDGCMGNNAGAIESDNRGQGNARYAPLTPSSSPANGLVLVPQQEICAVSNYLNILNFAFINIII
jgi:hypothetical protein